MANRTIGDFARSRLEVPDYKVDLSKAQIFSTVAEQATKMSNAAIEEWQKASVAEATREGSFAGQQPNVSYRPGNTLTAQAYNKAAQNGVYAQAQFKAISGLSELEEVYKLNPMKYQEESAQFIDDLYSSQVKSGLDVERAAALRDKMALNVQDTGYKISKAFAAQQIDEAKANTEMLLHSLKVNTFKGSGALFSADQAEQGLVLSTYIANSKAYDANLHAVLPDGTPVYSATAIQKRQQEFHTKFFTGAVQNWISEANLSAKDMKNIKDGTLTVDFPDGKKVSILQQVGVEAYEKEVQQFAITKLREKQAARSKQRALDKELMADTQAKNDILLLDDLYNGKPISATSLAARVESGQISLTTAKSAIKMMNDPAPVEDDVDFVTELRIKQIRGEDITDLIKSNSYRISSSTYKNLANYDVDKAKTLQSEDEKWIVREMVKKNNYGIEDPKSLRLANDTVEVYRQKLKDGKSTEVAFEEIRNTMDALKDRANMRAFNSVPKYSVFNGTDLDIKATGEDTLNAFLDGKIDEETYNIEIDRLMKINQENNRNKQ